MATLMNSQSTSSMDVFHHKPLSKQISSHNNVQSNISTPITSANIKPKGVSFPPPSPPRSPTSEKSSPSTTSTQSLASLTPSMSPSSIISLQRSARQEKRHHSHSINVIKQKQQQQQQILPQNSRRNRSDRSGTFSASENESIQQSSTKKSSKSPLNSNSNNSSSPSNRLSKWASSIRQSFSRSHSTPPPPQSPAASPQHSYLASPPISPVSDKTSIKKKKKSQYNSPTEKTIEPEYFNAHKKKALDLQLFADKAQKPTASAPEQTVSLQQQSRSTLATSSYPDHPRIRVMNQSRKKIIGSGLIILFCIIAVVILIILC